MRLWPRALSPCCLAQWIDSRSMYKLTAKTTMPLTTCKADRARTGTCASIP